VQLPADQHEIAVRNPPPLGNVPLPAFGGDVSGVAWAQVPEVSVAAMGRTAPELSVY
jgi:hypothetical protein